MTAGTDSAPEGAAGRSRDQLPERARVVIVGGGVIGVSIAYHLAKLGWRDVVLLGAALFHGLYGLRNILFELGPGAGVKKTLNAVLAVGGVVTDRFGDKLAALRHLRPAALPPVAKVAYARAISRGETETTPRPRV